MLGSGEVLTPDFVILASGSAYPFPAKARADRADDSQEHVRSTYKALAEAPPCPVAGGGPVGVELAGEIRAAWPDKAVTIVDMADDILGNRFSRNCEPSSVASWRKSMSISSSEAPYRKASHPLPQANSPPSL